MKKQPINTALCSFGMSGLVFHAPFINAHPKLNLYGVLERTKDLAKEKYPFVKTIRTLDQIVNDTSIALVVVNTPNITHYDFAKQLINAGKHVIVEKPFTVTSQQAKELITLADRKKVLLSVYHNRRWDSDFRTVQKIINRGVLGKIIEAEFHFDRFEPNLSYKIHKETPTAGVGNLYDLGSHLIDQALQLFGMPTSVFAHLNSFRKKSKVTDYFDLKLFYKSHSVSLKSSYFVREVVPSYIVHGTNGSFIKSRADIQEDELKKEVKPNRANWGLEQETERGLLYCKEQNVFKKELIESEQGDYMEYYDGVAQAILNKKPLPVSAIEAMQVIQIIEAAVESDKTKMVIDLVDYS
ncbi:Gfo/Idh/MocA family oxidoreductase [Aquimarina sp. W85]|uniref:Gfo/Idh/MocA family oxidoreductase n=1 Tax=Aquimarina rhodophyticola TaxID=3342246 RepID=UPI00366C5612